MSSRKRAGSHVPPNQSTVREIHRDALSSIRAFLRSKSCYDVFPVSFRVIVLDTKLEVKKALRCLILNGVVSACLWDNEQFRVSGILTVSDFVNLMAYYYKTSTYDDAAQDVESLRLDSLSDVERELGLETRKLVSVHPNASLWEASRLLVQTRSRRLPLVDVDSATGHDLVVSVLTQYRLLKFIAINCKESGLLHLPLRKLNIGTFVTSHPSEPVSETRFNPIRTATMDTPVFDVVNTFSQSSISAVPIIDASGRVLNLYETVDVIALVKSGSYYNLDMTISTALNMRSPDFPGVVTCSSTDSLASLLSLIKTRRVHRLVVVEGENEEREGGKRGRLLGIITLADILRYIVGNMGSTPAGELSPGVATTPSEISLKGEVPTVSISAAE